MQPKRPFGADLARAAPPPHAAKAFGSAASRGRTGAVQPYTTVAPDAEQYPGKKRWGFFADSDAADDEFFVRQVEIGNSWFADDKKTKPNLVKSSVVTILVSESCDLAIEATGHGQEAKVFFATMERVKQANTALRGKIGLVAGNEFLHITHDGQNKKLYRIEPQIKATRVQGLAIRVPQRCNDMAQFVSGNLDVTSYSAIDQGNRVALGILDEFTDRDWSGDFDRIKQSAYKDQSKQRDYLAIVDAIAAAYRAVVADDGDSVEFKSKLQALGANDYMNPALNAPVGTVSLADSADLRAAREENRAVFEYHWGTVVAKSGNDYVTLENYARYEGDITNCPLYFFKMYEIGAGKETWHKAATTAGYFLPPFISFTM